MNFSHLYKDVKINEQFTFTEDDDIRFIGKRTGGQDELEDLIERTDATGSLLEFKNIQMQPVADNATVAPPGTTFDQYTLVSFLSIFALG